MQFQIKRDTLLKSLSVAHNIIERKNTIPILANVLLEIKGNILNIIATDLDIVFHDQVSDLKIDNILYRCYVGDKMKISLGDIGSIVDMSSEQSHLTYVCPELFKGLVN